MSIIQVLKKAARALARAEARNQRVQETFRAEARKEDEERVALKGNYALLLGTMAQLKALRADEIATEALRASVEKRRGQLRQLDQELAAEAAKELKKLL
jgi:hypothetical protein